MPKSYLRRRRFFASMVVSLPGMVRPRLKGLFHLLKYGLISKRDKAI